MAQRLLQLSKELITNDEPLIFKYRKMSTLDKKEFKEVIYAKDHELRDRFFDLTMKNKAVFNHYHLNEQNRSEKRLSSAKELLFYGQNQLFTYEEYLSKPSLSSQLTAALYTYSPALSIKFGVHFQLYFKTIYNLGTKQHQPYLRRAFKMEDIGCFGLTELLHGSNVRGILTEAHYDHSTKQFVINSPSRNAMKFWIGASANLANMCVVWAQLYIDKKCYGVHAYIVPIRDTRTHELLPGVMIGDCGPKNGMDAIDNGFMMFDNVRIPKANQLNRLGGVDENGNYSAVQSPDKVFGLQLGALSGGRIFIMFSTPCMGLNALAIAIRYTLERRQFSAPKASEQTFLFDYPLTKFRLMPLLAQNVVYLIGGRHLTQVWDDNIKHLLDPKNKIVAQIHAISSAGKPKSTWFAAQVVSECRQMLGGHGFSQFSRLGEHYNDNDVNHTWEGDNNVLMQQTAKYLLDNAKKLMKGKQIVGDSLNFLKNPPTLEAITVQKLRCLDFLGNIYAHRVYTKLQQLAIRLQSQKSTGQTDYEIWNDSIALYVKPLTLYFGDLYYFNTAKSIISKFKCDNNKRVLTDCIRLWTYKILNADGFGSDDDRKMIQGLLMEYCQTISKEAVGILDCLAAPSDVIGSPFADQNGNGMKKYLNLVYSAKDTFRKVDWWQTVTSRNK